MLDYVWMHSKWHVDVAAEKKKNCCETWLVDASDNFIILHRQIKKRRLCSCYSAPLKCYAVHDAILYNDYIQ